MKKSTILGIAGALLFAAQPLVAAEEDLQSLAEDLACSLWRTPPRRSRCKCLIL